MKAECEMMWPKIPESGLLVPGGLVMNIQMKLQGLEPLQLNSLYPAVY
jgi:hypothetical protein